MRPTVVSDMRRHTPAHQAVLADTAAGADPVGVPGRLAGARLPVVWIKATPTRRWPTPSTAPACHAVTAGTPSRSVRRSGRPARPLLALDGLGGGASFTPRHGR